MHRRNRYLSARPSFAQLSTKCAELRPLYSPGAHQLSGSVKEGQIDFKDNRAVRALTRALLRVDFDLDVQLPEANLCPTVASRLDYLHLIEDLLEVSGVDYRTEAVRGLDIGTGASCIYPLLACRMHDRWTFVGTEIDPQSARIARVNVQRNALSARIAINEVHSQDEPLLSAAQSERLDFCMCNPPFYASPEDIQARRALKQTDSTGSLEYTASESIYPGGEVAFVERIIRESLALHQQITWYTSLLGTKQSVSVLERRLGELKVPHVKAMSLHVGATKRWILAWSFAGRKRLGAKRRRLKLLFPPHIRDPAAWLDETLAALLIQPEGGTRHRTTRQTWSRQGQRAISQGRLESLAVLELPFTIESHGSVSEFSLADPASADGANNADDADNKGNADNTNSTDSTDDADTPDAGRWDNLVSLVNHLRSRLSTDKRVRNTHA